MKKASLAILLILFVLSSAFAASVYTSSLDNYPLLAKTSTTGASTFIADFGMGYDEFTCVVTWSGTTPVDTTVALEGSLDGTTFAALSTQTITTTGTMFHVVDKYVRYVRGNYVSKTGGDATTAVTMSCSGRQR